MPLFDTIAAIILVISLIYSMVRGMVREIFALLAYIGGYFAAITFGKDFSSTLKPYISNPTALQIISFALIFMVTLFAISLIGKGIQKLVHSAPGLSGLDRVFGGVIGLGKGIILLIILLFPLQFFPDIHKEITRDSFFAPKLNELSKVLGRGVDTDKIVDKLPKFDLDGVKKQLKGLKDIKDSLKPEETEPEHTKGKSQEGHSKEDKNELNSILLSLEKK
jgi:membrane protein required for colicin V production